MGSPETLDFDALLAPIPGDNPAGADLRGDPALNSPYRAIRDARRASATAERQLVQLEAAMRDGDADAQREAAAARGRVDWQTVLKLAPEVLATRTKDLEIGAYLIEAQVRQHGFPGLRDGFRLVRELVERYWDQLYPLPDEEGISTRLVFLGSLNGEGADNEGRGTLIDPIRRIHLAESKTHGPFASWHYSQATGLTGIASEAREDRIKRGAITIEVFEQAARGTPPAKFAALATDLEECLDEFSRMTQILDERCRQASGGYQHPSTQIQNTLQNCLDIVKKYGPKAADVRETPVTGEIVVVGDNGSGPPAMSGGLATREDAFHVLTRVAEFFERTEPQSIVPSALRQVVRWGKMAPSEFYLELITDESAREHLFRMTGIRVAENKEGQ